MQGKRSRKQTFSSRNESQSDYTDQLSEKLLKLNSTYKEYYKSKQTSDFETLVFTSSQLLHLAAMAAGSHFPPDYATMRPPHFVHRSRDATDIRKASAGEDGPRNSGPDSSVTYLQNRAEDVSPDNCQKQNYATPLPISAIKTEHNSEEYESFDQNKAILPPDAPLSRGIKRECHSADQEAESERYLKKQFTGKSWCKPWPDSTEKGSCGLQEDCRSPSSESESDTPDVSPLCSPLSDCTNGGDPPASEEREVLNRLAALQPQALKQELQFLIREVTASAEDEGREMTRAKALGALPDSCTRV